MIYYGKSRFYYFLFFKSITAFGFYTLSFFDFLFHADIIVTKKPWKRYTPLGQDPGVSEVEGFWESEGSDAEGEDDAEGEEGEEEAESEEDEVVEEVDMEDAEETELII